MTDLRDQPNEDEVMDHHVVYRDGSVWACRFCKTTWPFPSPLPDVSGPCVPRRWSENAAEVTGGRAESRKPSVRLPAVYRPAAGGPAAIDWPCPKCHVPAGERCLDERGAGAGMRRTLRPHKERR